MGCKRWDPWVPSLGRESPPTDEGCDEHGGGSQERERERDESLSVRNNTDENWCSSNPWSTWLVTWLGPWKNASGTTDNIRVGFGRTTSASTSTSTSKRLALPLSRPVCCFSRTPERTPRRVKRGGGSRSRFWPRFFALGVWQVCVSRFPLSCIQGRPNTAHLCSQ